MSGWGCPHEAEGRCNKVRGRACDPGMKGCVLAGRFRFSNEDKNRPPAVGAGDSKPATRNTDDPTPDQSERKP